MVRITIFIEGGVLPSRENPELTPGPSILLRESFHQLLTQKIPHDKFDLNVEPRSGYKNAAALFKSEAPKNRNAVILLDFAEPAQNLRRSAQLGTREQTTEPFDINDPIAFRAQCITELGLGEYQSRVFFMIQEMESWILAQPDKIESFGQKEGFIRKQPEVSIASHNFLTGCISNCRK